MGNQLNEKATEPVAKTYSEADIRAAQAETAARMLADQNRALQAARYGMPPPPRPMGPDPMAIFSEKNLTNTAEENTRLLDAATRMRARQEAAAIGNETLRIARAEQAESENRNAINNLLANNPDVQADQEGFAATMTKAQFRAASRGIELVGPDLVREALMIYRKEHERPSSASETPVLEGASNADSGGIPKPKPAEQPKGKSLYERFYGKGPADELHEEEIDQDKMLFDYADGKNEYLEKMGVPLQFSEIRQTQEGNMERSARKAQRGA